MKTRHHVFIVTAICLLLLNGCTRKYSSAATIQFKYQEPTEAQNVLRALLEPTMANVDVRPIRNTDLFQISVIDIDSQKAADDANSAAAALQSKVKSTYPEATFTIWERAEPMNKQ